MIVKPTYVHTFNKVTWIVHIQVGVFLPTFADNHTAKLLRAYTYVYYIHYVVNVHVLHRASLGNNLFVPSVLMFLSSLTIISLQLIYKKILTELLSCM